MDISTDISGGHYVSSLPLPPVVYTSSPLPDLLPGGGDPTGVENTEPLVLGQLPVTVLVRPAEHPTNLREKEDEGGLHEGEV